MNNAEIVEQILARHPDDRLPDELLSDIERRALHEFTTPRKVGGKRVWLLDELRGER